MRYFYVKKLTPEVKAVQIGGSDAHHICKVLRLQRGDRIRLLDGRGCVYEAVIEGFSARHVQLAVRHHFASPAESPIQISVGQGFLKEKKMDGLVRQLSELGVNSWFPVFSEYAVARPASERLSVRHQRWEKIAAESLKQCRRGQLMEIRSAVTFSEALQDSEAFKLKVIFWEQATRKLNPESLTALKPGDGILALLGPEGGFSPSEAQLAERCGFVPLSLGPRVLRAETATITATALLQFVFGDIGKK